MIIDAAFKWPVANDYVIETDAPAQARRGHRAQNILSHLPSSPRLVAKGGVKWETSPSKLGTNLGQQLITNCGNWGRRAGIIRFGKRYGMLTAASQPGDYEPLSLWDRLITSLSAARRGERVTARLSLAKLKITRGGIALVPETLRSAIEAEAFLMGRGVEIKECPGCGQLFQVGGNRANAPMLSFAPTIAAMTTIIG